MRLIDADDVIKCCCSHYGHCYYECEKCGFAKSVEKIPTAFDVDMVTEQIEGCEHIMVDDEIMISMNDVLNIVKDGGIYD